MLDSGSTWWNQLEKSRLQYREVHKAKVSQECDDLDNLFRSLSLKCVQKVNADSLAGVAKIEEERHAKKLADLASKREIESLLVKKAQDDERRIAELKTQQKQLERELKARTDLTEKLNKEREELEVLKKANTAREKKDKENATALEKIRREKKEENDKSRTAEQTASAIKEEEKKSQTGLFSNKPAGALNNAPSTAFSNTTSAFGNTKPANNAFMSTKPTDTKPAAASQLSATQPTAAQSTAAQPTTTQSTDTKSLDSASASDQEFSANAARIEWIKVNVRKAMSSQPKEVKNYLMDVKMQLRPKFGMLTNSKSQLIKCRNSVKELFTQAKQNSNPLIYQNTLNLYSKLLVEQSESEANVQLQNALPLAMLTVLLWADFPELGDFVIPRFVKKCPQLIGYHCNISTQEGRKRMGWKQDEDTGKYETQEQYMGRLSGICAVWACMTQSKLTQQVNHPYPLTHSWTFLARLLNKPLDSVTAVDYCLAAAWWDMTAMRFAEAFGKQGIKLLELTWNKWTEGRTDPPALRLRGLGENWKTSGKIDHAWKPLA